MVMLSGTEKLSGTIWHPLHGTPALELQRQFGNQVPHALHRDGQCTFVTTPQTTQARGNWGQGPLKARQALW